MNNDPFGKKLDLFHPHWNFKFFCMFSCLVGFTDSSMECITIEPSIIQGACIFSNHISQEPLRVIFCEEVVLI